MPRLTLTNTWRKYDPEGRFVRSVVMRMDASHIARYADGGYVWRQEALEIPEAGTDYDPTTHTVSAAPVLERFDGHMVVRSFGIVVQTPSEADPAVAVLQDEVQKLHALLQAVADLVEELIGKPYAAIPEEKRLAYDMLRAELPPIRQPADPRV